MAIFETELGMNRQGLEWVNEMVVQGILTDAAILGMASVADLRAVTFTGYESGGRRFYEMFQRSVDRSQAIGTLTDAAVAAADTVAGLRALFTANDANLVADQLYSTVG